MNIQQKITLFGMGTVGAIGSVLLLSKYLGSNDHKTKKRKKKSKRELILQRRRDIQQITKRISFTPNGDNAQLVDNVLYSDECVAHILSYLSTFDYLHTVCLLSKYHYLYLHHSHIHYHSLHKYVTFNMLLNESNKSWNRAQIERIFSEKPFADIYDFMYSVCNDWKYASCSQSTKYDSTSPGNVCRHLQIIQEMICVPFMIPNIHVVQYYFCYISQKTDIPIRHLSFRTPTNARDDHGNHALTHYFLSALENPFELNLFLWIILYDLYQLNIELNKPENQDRNIIHSNYFGFEHKLQEWIVLKHEYTFLQSDMMALLKLYNMIMNTYDDCSRGKNMCFYKNMVYILCIMFKVLFHNTELHIVRLNKCSKHSKDIKQEWLKLEEIFLQNLYNVITFIQYVVQINNTDPELLKLFTSFVKKSNAKMVRNILQWFCKVNHQNDAHHMFRIKKQNILSLSVLPSYFQLMALQTKAVDDQHIAIWLSSIH